MLETLQQFISVRACVTSSGSVVTPSCIQLFTTLDLRQAICNTIEKVYEGVASSPQRLCSVFQFAFCNLPRLSLCAGRPGFQTVRDKCFEVCVTKPSSSLGSSEQQCLARCLDRYSEVRRVLCC